MQQLIRTLLPSFFLILVGALLIGDMFLHPGIFFAHDIEQNIARFGAFYHSLSEGHLFPRWADGIANGYGGPILMFSYSFPYYIASVFRFLGFSLIDSIKLLMAVCAIGSGVGMYVWLRQHGNTTAALAGAMLYVLAPYRITDIYARGSISEQTAFLVVPFVLLAIHRVWQRPTIRSFSLFTIAHAVLILTHPFFVIMFSSFFLFYSLYLLFQRYNARCIGILFSGVLVSFALTSYYILPLTYESKYTHYDISPFNGRTFYDQYNSMERLIMPVWFFYGKYGEPEYITYQVGVLHWTLFLGSLAILYHMYMNRHYRFFPFLLFGIAAFLLSLFFMLPLSYSIYAVLRPLQQIQFPWRFLSLSVTSLAVVTAASIAYTRRWAKQSVFAIFIVACILYLPYANGHRYTDKGDHYYREQFETNTEGPGTQPRWAAGPEHYVRRSQFAEIVSGSGNISFLSRTSTRHQYTVEATESAIIVDNTFYFPGWVVTVDNKPTEIQFQNPDYRGLITFATEPGTHEVEVLFTETKFRKIANILSAITFAMLVAINVIVLARKHYS